MKSATIIRAGLAVGLLAASANAAVVTYTPTGVFTGGTTPNTNVFTSSNALVYFTGTPGTAVGTPSNVTFGNFVTNATTATSATPVSSPFTLTITQSAPTGGSGTFSATLAGTLSVSSTSAYLQFAAPLTITVGGEQYTIAENDEGIAGRIDLAPPSTGGTVSLIGRISEVPEPATLGLAGVAALGLARRRRR